MTHYYTLLSKGIQPKDPRPRFTLLQEQSLAVALVQPQYGILRLSSFFFVLNLFYSSSYSYTSGGGADSVDLRYITFFF